jgi:hypothetical protein
MLLLTIAETFALADVRHYGQRRKLETAMTVATMLSNQGLKVSEGMVMKALDQLAFFKLLEFKDGLYTITVRGHEALKDANQGLKMLTLALDRQVGY